MSKLTLVIPDAHAHPDQSNKRFDLLSDLIMDRRPDTIVCIGDFSDVPSMSSYDKGKGSFEGRRFRDDVAVTIDASDRMFKGMRQFNERARRNKDRQYLPKRIMTLGNHEARIDRAVNDNPELEGTLSIDCFKYKDYWDQIVAYKEAITVDGVLYSHHCATGVSGRPIGGVNMGRSLIQKNLCSTTVGHSHLWSFATETTRSGQKVHGLSVGCFQDYVPSFAVETGHMWWSGVVLKHNVVDGDYDLEQVSLHRMKKIYG